MDKHKKSIRKNTYKNKPCEKCNVCENCKICHVCENHSNDNSSSSSSSSSTSSSTSSPSDKKKISKQNDVLSNDYVIIEQIGSGSFGEVYLAQYKKGNYVAAKVEDRKRNPRIINEYKIYKYLHSKEFKTGLPKIYDFIQTKDYNIMIMQLMGPSLEDLFNKYDRKFKLNTVLLIGIQIIDLLERLHKTNYIHRDIKPNNFLVERGKNACQIFMMDFGLSKKYIENGSHIKFRDKRSLIGTARYASINMHMGIEPTRRDDLESVGYMLIYFLKGSLPWQGVKKQRHGNHLEIIGETKMCTSLDTLCKNLPSCFIEYLKYCRKLKFDETPDYNYMKNLFLNTSEKMNIDLEFQWCYNK